MRRATALTQEVPVVPRFIRLAFAVSVFAASVFVLPGAYTASDQATPGPSDPEETVEAPSPEPEPTASENPAAEPTASETPAPEPTPEPEPTASVAPEPEPSASPVEGEGAAEDEQEGSQTPGEVVLAVSAAPGSIAVGENTILTATLSNAASDPVRDVDLAIAVPDALDFGSANPAASDVGSAPDGSTEVLFRNVTVPREATKTFTLIVAGEESSAKPVSVLVDASWQEGDAATSIGVLVGPAESTLTLTTKGNGLLTEVGGRVRYDIELRNSGDETLEDVSLVNLVPGEVHVIAAGLAPGVDAVQVGNAGGKEDIVWIINELAAGKKVNVSYTGVVERAGDLQAVNSTRARAGEAPPVRSEASTYLAAAGAGSSNNPPFTPERRERVIHEQVTERPLIAKRVPTSPDSPPGPGELPFTGLDPWGLVAVGVLLVFIGALSVRIASGGADRRRVAVAALALLLVGGACISNDSEPGEPRVKGVQIERTNPGDPQGPADPDDGSTPGDPGPVDDDEQPDGSNPNGGQPDGNDDSPTTTDLDSPTAIDPDAPLTEIALVPGPPVTRTVSRVKVVTITAEDLPVLELGSVKDTGTATFSWNDGSSTIGSAASSTSAVAGGVELTAQVSPGGDGMVAIAVLRNTSERSRVAVNGNLALELSGPGGRLATLEGVALDLLLNPGGQTTASFNFRLPSGSYGATALFQAS